MSTGSTEAFHMEKASALLPHSALWVGPELQCSLDQFWGCPEVTSMEQIRGSVQHFSQFVSKEEINEMYINTSSVNGLIDRLAYSANTKVHYLCYKCHYHASDLTF